MGCQPFNAVLQVRRRDGAGTEGYLGLNLETSTGGTSLCVHFSGFEALRLETVARAAVLDAHLFGSYVALQKAFLRKGAIAKKTSVRAFADAFSLRWWTCQTTGCSWIYRDTQSAFEKPSPLFDPPMGHTCVMELQCLSGILFGHGWMVGDTGRLRDGERHSVSEAIDRAVRSETETSRKKARRWDTGNRLRYSEL